MTTSRDEEMPDPAAAALLPNTPLLITETADEFDRICAALSHEIRPNGIIEQMYVADIAQLAWEILRLRRCKALIINLAFRGALEELAVQLLRNPGQSKFQLKDEAEKLAEAWFSEDSAKKRFRACSIILTSMNQPSKRKPSEDQPRTLSCLINCWHH
jgi:hypothetical protein